MKTNKKTFIVMGSVCLGLCLILLTLLLIRNSSPYASNFIALYITQPIVAATGFINSLFAHSVFEVTVIATILSATLLIILLIYCFVKRNFATAFKGLLIVAIICLSAGNFYALTTGMLYNRSAVPVPQSTQKYDNTQVTDIAEHFLADYNSLAQKLNRDSSGNVISPYTVKQLSKLIGTEYNKVNNGYFFKYTPRGKKLINSWFMTATNITGITCLPFGEPVVNGKIPSSELPQVLAHEMAHAKGVMREGDCNFVSYYVLLNSTNDYLRYCGYFAAFNNILYAVDLGQKTNENYKRLVAERSPLIIKESRNAYDFWTSGGAINNFFGKVGDFFNNLYLKMSGVNNGSNSYEDTSSDGDITDSGEKDPETGDIIYDITYSSVQKLFFHLYEQAI